MVGWLYEQLQNLGLSAGGAVIVVRGVAFIGVLITAWIANLLARRFMVRAVHFLVSRTETDWDDVLIGRGFFHEAAHLAPAVVVYLSAPLFGSAQGLAERLTLVYVVAIVLRAFGRLTEGALDLYNRTEISREKPLRGYVQILQIALWIVGMIFMVSTLLERDPWGLLTGLGAMSAVLLLVFRDSILGFVASVQLFTNNMVRLGDWIEVPAYAADGDVIDISLHTVKVQNFDKTISTIPTHALVTGTFRNWRGMKEAGGRRIKRAVFVDIGTIRFCDEELLDRFERYAEISEYIRKKRAELSEGAEGDPPINRRRLTNIGTFRIYIEAYLKRHPMIARDMTLIVRQLAPCERGLPIEIYCFSRDTVWANYEALQADIFDHILAIAPDFELGVYQQPSSNDLSRLLTSRAASGQPA